MLELCLELTMHSSNCCGGACKVSFGWRLSTSSCSPWSQHGIEFTLVMGLDMPSPAILMGTDIFLIEKVTAYILAH